WPEGVASPSLLHHLFDRGRDVEQALRAKEESVLDPTRALHEPHVPVQRRKRVVRRHAKEAAPALGIELRGDRDRFDERRLAAPVLADKERDLGIELELLEVTQRGDRERIRTRVLDLVTLHDERTDERIGHDASLWTASER